MFTAGISADLYGAHREALLSFDKQGQSEKYVKKFFETFVATEHRKKLEYGFEKIVSGPAARMSLEMIVELLYKTRCEVIHEGNTWGLTFHDGVTSMVSGDPPVMVHITIAELRTMVVEGCIAAISRKLETEKAESRDPCAAP